jgi:hypothetical protein
MAANLKWVSQSPGLFAHAVQIIKDAIDAIVEWFFGFSPAAARRRQSFRSLLFLALYAFFVWTEFVHNPTAMQHYNTFINAATVGLSPELIVFLQALWSVAISLPVLRELLVIFVPYLLALEFAAIYQHDVIERDVEITRAFINQAVFAAHYNVIHVREGKVIPEDEESPILLVGGPGLVEVELDSAIMLEDADFDARIIGPTGKKRGGMEVLSDFERIRQSFDLRERSVTIPSEKIPPITIRTRDGIMVEAKDLHYVFSVNRGDAPPTKDMPYPFDEKSLINFVYNGPPKTQGWKNPIATDMNMPITLELSGFIGKRFTGEFLASIGQPEMEAYEQRKQARDEVASQLAGAVQAGESEPFPKQGEFMARTAISDLLNGENFRKSALGKGFSLRWVGVGTWNTAAKIIPELHLEAWQTSRNNVMRGSESALKKIQVAAKSDHMLNLISQMVLTPYFDHLDNTDSNKLVDHLIGAYYQRLRALQEEYIKANQPVPESLPTAIAILAEVLPYHDVHAEDEEE